MLRYILLISILLILFGHLQPMGAGQPQRGDAAVQKLCNQEKYEQKQSEAFFDKLVKIMIENNSWHYYKKTFISKDGRVIDHQRGSVTTSEGQAYAMRRALLMYDKGTFDKTYDWAKYNLQRKNDKLFAWLWGKMDPGQKGEVEYGVLDEDGASDAGTEIAVSLIFAYKVWGQKSYLDDALKIMNDIWDKETVEIKGERIIIAGDNQKSLENVEVNPSYFLIYGFRVFAEVDKEHDWQKLVDSSYRLINYCIDNIPSGLPPDIFYINRKTGEIIFDKEKSDFSYDAVRVFYRVYIDYILTKDQRAKALLSKSRLFVNRWKREYKFYTCYKQDGQLKNHDEAIGSIALLLPVIKMYDKNVAEEIYQNRIKAKYNRKGYWGDPMDYYAQNLVWFGNWLYQNEENVRSFKYQR